MKKLKIIFLLFLLGCKSNVEVLEYYPGGAVRKEKIHHNHNKYDLVSYYRSGKINCKETRINELVEGEVVCYYINGNLNFKRFFVNGFMSGQQKEFFENGKIKSISNYNYGKKEGLQKRFDRKGNVIFKENYKNNQLINFSKFDSLGNIINEIEYDNNGCISLEKNRTSDNQYIQFKKYSECQLTQKGYLLNGLLHSNWLLLDGNDTIERGFYNKGKKNGKWHYSRDFKTFNNDVLHGPFEYYDSKDNLIAKGEFDNGKLILDYFKRKGSKSHVKNGNGRVYFEDEFAEISSGKYLNGKLQ